MNLRPYQRRAIDALYDALRKRDDNPCIVMPTGGGKTPLIVQICEDAVAWGGRVLVLAHVKELLRQAADSILHFAPILTPKVGIYSAGLKSRETGVITIAGIQSVYKRAAELGSYDLILIDECHLLPEDGEGMYRTLLTDMKAINPEVRLIGLTATPYRMRGGMICKKENLLNHICHETGIKELINDGFLTRLKTRGTVKARADFSELKIVAGEFVDADVTALIDRETMISAAVEEIVRLSADRKKILVFAAGVEHAQHVADEIRAKTGEPVGTVFGDTASDERDALIRDFVGGALRWVVNVNVLTTGFDAPNIDCIVLLRPTASPGLYYQMVGRGFRVAPDKEYCAVLDFGGNVMRHGPVDAIVIRKGKANEAAKAPVKECPDCGIHLPPAVKVCPDCGYKWPEIERKHDTQASEAEILGEAREMALDVLDTTYHVHVKYNNPDAPQTMRVEYYCGSLLPVKEWVCVEHTGYAGEKAEYWWKRRSSLSMPQTAEEAVRLAQAGALAPTKRITVRHRPGEKFDRVISYELGEKPKYREPGEDEVEESTVAELFSDEECPF